MVRWDFNLTIKDVPVRVRHNGSNWLMSVGERLLTVHGIKAKAGGNLLQLKLQAHDEFKGSMLIRNWIDTHMDQPFSLGGLTAHLCDMFPEERRQVALNALTKGGYIS
jgi:hypothetical protein